jgi:2-isopropylmalate synthase
MTESATPADDGYVYLYDTTLRDGAQTQGVDFSVQDKVNLARALDRLGVDYVEGGWPGANPTDNAFFAKPPSLATARLAAFGMTRRPGRSTDNDPGLQSILDADVPVTCIVGKTWDFHVDLVLDVPHDENIAMIRDSVAHAVARGKEAMFDAEHFFDGYKANPDYALACAVAGYEAGARWVVLCDTNGGTLPDEVSRIVAAVSEKIPGSHLGIHAHNDTENAVANSLAAVRAGVRQVQGTINGLGERCGNANLISLAPSLMLKAGYRTGISTQNLAQLTPLSRLLDEILNRQPHHQAAYVGASAFAHKGGLHVSAVLKDPRTYEHINPTLVGNARHIVVSDQAGRSNVLERLREVGLVIAPDHPRLSGLIEELKEREFQGYTYDGAEASFELLARHMLDRPPEYFRLRRFRIIDDRRWNARGELVTESEATTAIFVDGETVQTVATGNGPVNALDGALRKALVPFYPSLETLDLRDFKVRILDSRGTGSLTRVMIGSVANGSHDEINTVGLSTNILDASYNALYDAITFALFKGGVASRLIAEA